MSKVFTKAIISSPERQQEADADFDVVKKVQAGDVAAFDRLILKYRERVFGVVYNLTANREDASDLTQDAFIKAFQSINRFQGHCSFFTWLYRIAVNTAKKALVDMKRDPTVPEAALRPGDDDDETYRPGNEPTTDETPESILAANEIAATVNAAMEALPAELRQAVTLREIEGMSYEEIAEVMNCPIGTVRSRIYRAREAISARVKPMLDNQSGKRW
ncbi:MAG: sigma-70 family RNA polymerase sigma factor [Variovorax sp.]